jgi:hypothetical protein
MVRRNALRLLRPTALKSVNFSVLGSKATTSSGANA